MKLRRPPARNALTFTLACLAALTMLFISEASTWRARRSLLEISDIGQARAGIQLLEAGLRDAAISVPGGAAPQSPIDTSGHAQALSEIDKTLSMLTAHYVDDPVGASLLAALRLHIERRLARLAGGAAAAGDAPAEREPLAAVRDASAALLAHERRKQLVAQQAVDKALQIGRIGIAALSAISLLSLSLFLWQAAAIQRQQRALQTLERADRDRLEQEVAHRTAELTELHRHLLSAREDERARLARDLHDDLGALLTSAKLDAARLRSRLGRDAPEAQERLASLVRMLDGVIALKRRIVEDLRPSALDTVGLVAALEILAREFAERTGLEVISEFEPVARSAEAELVLFRLLQEATTNIAKHAKARRVSLVLREDNGDTLLRVSDDGVGFDASRAPGSAHGLAGMRFRVHAENGTMTVDSQPGVGTTIEVRLPPAFAAGGAPPAAA
jgi:signal transduction histidine kinase